MAGELDCPACMFDISRNRECTGELGCKRRAAPPSAQPHPGVSAGMANPYATPMTGPLVKSKGAAGLPKTRWMVHVNQSGLRTNLIYDSQPDLIPNDSGALTVVIGDRGAAVFAPGQWIWARVEETGA